MAVPYNSYEHELDRIKQHLYTARDAREYEYYARLYEDVRRNLIMVSNGGTGVSMTASTKIPEPVTPLSFLKNANKLLLIGA